MSINWSEYQRGYVYPHPTKKSGFLVKNQHSEIQELNESRIYDDYYIKVYKYTTDKGKIVGYVVEPNFNKQYRTKHSMHYANIYTNPNPGLNRGGILIVKEQSFWIMKFRSGRYCTYSILSRIRNKEQKSEDD